MEIEKVICRIWDWTVATICGRNAQNLYKRIVRYRIGGGQEDGLHTLLGKGIDDRDYLLMGCDCSCSRINYPDISEGELITGQWFKLKKGSDISKRLFGNSHGTSDDGGKTFYTETAYFGIPAHRYSSSVEEVVWHFQRVTKLRRQNVPNSERIRIMTEERALKPWVRRGS